MPKYRRAVNKVTEELYNQIKPVVKTTRDYNRGKKTFGVSETTLRKIKNTRDFAEYNAKTIKAHPKEQVELLGCYDIDEPEDAATLRREPGEIIELDNEQLDRIENKLVSREELQEAIDEIKIIVALGIMFIIFAVVLARVF